MRIAEVKISNFRTIFDATVNFHSVTSFVGPNGVGKSTILYALDWFFNGSKIGELTSRDATYGHENQDIEVRVIFDQLNDDDRDALGKYVSDESDTFTAWKIRNHLNGEERLSANIKGFELFSSLKIPGLSAADLKTAYKKIQSNHPELELKNAGTKNAVLEELTRWESENPDRLVNMSEEVATSFNGFNSNSALAARFRFTLVKADLRANEEAEDGRNSLLSEIVERAVDRKSADAKLADAFSSIKVLEEQVYDDVFNEPLKDLTTQLNAVVNDYTSNRSVEIKPNIQDITPPKTTFKIQVNDGKYQTDVTKQGHGFQRTLLISALQLLSEQSGEGDNGTLCLAIEEPELFQHPLQAQVFASVLRKLAENDNHEIQVTYATHSPYFLEAKHFDQIYRLVRHVSDGSYETHLYHASMDDINSDLSDYYYNKKKKKTVNKKDFLNNVYANDLPIGVYANEVILVEGSTDKIILEGVSGLMKETSLSRKGIAVISCGSKSNIPAYYTILHRLGIPTKIMFDNDSGWEKRSNKTGDKKIREEEDHLSQNKKLIEFFNIIPENVHEGFPDAGLYNDIFIVDDTLEPFLKDKWSGWEEAYSQAETDLAIYSNKNEELYAEAIRHLLIDDCPDDLSRFFAAAMNAC